jgi:hypothetical protein
MAVATARSPTQSPSKAAAVYPCGKPPGNPPTGAFFVVRRRVKWKARAPAGSLSVSRAPRTGGRYTVRAVLVAGAVACLLSAAGCAGGSGVPPSGSKAEAETRNARPPCLGDADGECASGNPMDDF